jgi:hypothetical protein
VAGAVAEQDHGRGSVGAGWLDTAGAVPTVVCQVADGCCLRMSPSAYWLFGEIEKGRSAEQIAELVREKFGQEVDVAAVSKASAELMAAIDEEVKLAQLKRRRRYIFRIRLVPESLVGKIARRLEFLFCLPVALAYLTLAGVGSYLLFCSDAPREVAAHLTSGTGFLAAYLIYLVALAAHELGHATACSRYRMRPGDIGFAVYLVFPAVYCDVTRAWLLPRRQRVVVDLSGLLFEVGVGAFYATLGALLHAWVLSLSAFLVLGNLVWALNPFGRFDVYWTMNDALGLVDLSADRWRILRDTLLPGRRVRAPRPNAIVLGKGAKAFLLGYGICSVLVIGVFGYGVMQMGGAVVAGLQASCAHLVREAAQGQIAAVLRGGIGLLFPAAVVAVMSWRLAAIGVVPLARRINRGRSQKSPPTRSASRV